MYGMLLESVQHFVQLEYGEEVWRKVLALSGCKYAVFNTHQVYPDNIMASLASALATTTSNSYESFMMFFGKCFVRFFSNYGYDATIKATGRYFTDFLDNVDNIHSQFRLSYPKMKSPSMYLTDVDENGCILVYRSQRQGFTHYVMGQLEQIANEIYNLNLNTSVVDQEISTAPSGKTLYIVNLRLNFDNSHYIESKKAAKATHLQLTSWLPAFSCDLLFELFPFAVLFDPAMTVVGCGGKLLELAGGCKEQLLRQPLDNMFKLRRPKGIAFTWKNAFYLKSVMFEIEVLRSEIMKKADDAPKESSKNILLEQEIEIDGKSISPYTLRRDSTPGLKNILLKGQMYYLQDVIGIIYLCSPVINNISELTDHGLYLNDLNPHGLGREMVLAGWQNNSKLQYMFDKAEQRATELENNYMLLDTWKRRGDDLLYSMIPKSVADRLRTGHSPLSTCESFDLVTVMFCELVGLNSTTVQDAMELVSTMNAVFSCFDSLMDTYNVYKVETVGQIYMAVCGAPERNENHAQNIIDVSLCMAKHVKQMQMPSRAKVDIRIG
ncbi:unnamed protein product [Acanthoscelides obtectus]|nr:unnamed protein product [Acanthoscelides obtectus]CAK1640568.1 Soluble guanylate cyclase 89Db [Acanthoscelides obtectus]